MTVAVNDIISRAQSTLQDNTAVRWLSAELVNFINDAQREIALLKPDASAANTTLQLNGGTKQTIPSDGNRLLRVVRNMDGTSASSPGGRAVRLVQREVLDSQSPTWHDANDAATSGSDAAHGTIVKHYIYDEQNPRNFYVYPGITGTEGSSASAYLEIIYSKNPAAVSAGGNISIPDIFANAILDYTLFRAYTKDAEFAGNATRANTHYNLFINSVTGKGRIDVVTSPNAVSNAAAAGAPLPSQMTG